MSTSWLRKTRRKGPPSLFALSSSFTWPEFTFPSNKLFKEPRIFVFTLGRYHLTEMQAAGSPSPGQSMKKSLLYLQNASLMSMACGLAFRNNKKGKINYYYIIIIIYLYLSC